MVCVGEWVDDVPHGRGVCRFADGNVYDGQWTHGKMTGVGKLTNKAGTYTGELQNGLFDGFGIMVYNDRSTYALATHSMGRCEVVRILRTDTGGRGV